jgi:flagellar biosynthesis protein FlhB
MNQPISNPEQELQTEIAGKIKHRRKFEVMDFRLAHIFLWVSILASFTSTIIVAFGVPVGKEILFAVIAGVPGLIILIDKTFDFKKRAVWGAMFRIELEDLKDEFVFKKGDPYEIAKKLRQIERKYELLYSEIGFFSQKKEPK